jgi:hypothetical protein
MTIGTPDKPAGQTHRELTVMVTEQGKHPVFKHGE